MLCKEKRIEENGLCKINQGSEHSRLANNVPSSFWFVKNNRICLFSKLTLANDSIKNLEDLVTSLTATQELNHEFCGHEVLNQVNECNVQDQSSEVKRCRPVAGLAE